MSSQSFILPGESSQSFMWACHITHFSRRHCEIRKDKIRFRLSKMPTHFSEAMKNLLFVVSLLFAGVQAVNAQSQVMQELLNNPRVDANTRVRALNTLMDSLQTALDLPKREIMPEEKVGSRGYARLDQRALAASFQDMVEALDLDMEVPEVPFNPREILALVVGISEAAQNQPPSVQTYVATELGVMLARLQGAVVKDGRKTLQAWGFKLGTDSTLTDSILVPFDSIPFGTGHYGNFLDTSAVDTGAFYLTQRNLAPSTTYFFSAWGENEEGIAHGDTLSFLTLVGVSTENAIDLTDSTGTIKAAFTYGDVAPTSVGLKWSENAELSGASDSVIALGVDNTITWQLADLVKDSTYYFTAYGTNASGTTYGDTLSFRASSDPCFGDESVTYDGHSYPLVGIGSQCWFAENLRTTKYADGTNIPEVSENMAWGNLDSGARAAYNNEATNVQTYGYIYNWHAVMDDAGLCPTGWHVPTYDEWFVLTNALGGIPVAGEKLKSSSTDSPSWDGTNTSGFSGLPGGLRDRSTGEYREEGEGGRGFWWSSTPANLNAWLWVLNSDSNSAGPGQNGPRLGVSVRCLKD